MLFGRHENAKNTTLMGVHYSMFHKSINAIINANVVTFKLNSFMSRLIEFLAVHLPLFLPDSSSFDDYFDKKKPTMIQFYSLNCVFIFIEFE